MTHQRAAGFGPRGTPQCQRAAGFSPRGLSQCQRAVGFSPRGLSQCQRAVGFNPCYFPRFEGCPVGASENSPAIYRRDDVGGLEPSPVGTIERVGPSAVPTGLGSLANTAFPAMNRWATVRCPSGTRRRRAREGLQDVGNSKAFARAVLRRPNRCATVGDEAI